MRPPSERTADHGKYGDWRHDSLSRSWAAFPDSHIDGKTVLDFGCGDGELSFFLAREKYPRRVVGVDINADAIARANKAVGETSIRDGVDIDFVVGQTETLPVADESFDTLVAFDCLEHVMEPAPIVRDWYRVLRRGGRCLIEWFPYKGPWGPHMEALIPIPLAHVIFGEHALFRTAERIYDLSEFAPRHWDLDEEGNKKPNKWRAWSTFEEQQYINQLDLKAFRNLARDAGFQLARFELHGFGGSWVRQAAGRTLVKTPFLGEYFVSYVIVELRRPE